jgi:hypothetical protein
MNPNYILALLLVLILLTFFSCMIAGDVFLSKIAFNSVPMNCENFTGDTNNTGAANSVTTAAALASGTTTTAAAVLTAKNKYNSCAELDNVQVGFAKFRIVMYWIMFIVLTILGSYFGINILKFGTVGMVILGLGIILWIFMLVGGVFLSQFAFEASEKKCNNNTNYCYNLNDAQIFFARLTSVMCFPMTFALMGICIGLLYRSV